MVAFKPKRADHQATVRDKDVDTPGDLVVVARLGMAYGVKGWIKIHPFSHSPDALQHADVWWIAPYLPNQADIPLPAWQRATVKHIKAHADAWVAQFDAWDNRSVAEGHKGWSVAVSRADFPSTNKDEFYWVDLIGATVVNQQGIVLGTIECLLESAAHPVMQIVNENIEYLIPFVSAFVGEVDVIRKIINVEWDAQAHA